MRLRLCHYYLWLNWLSVDLKWSLNCCIIDEIQLLSKFIFACGFLEMQIRRCAHLSNCTKTELLMRHQTPLKFGSEARSNFARLSLCRLESWEKINFLPDRKKVYHKWDHHGRRRRRRRLWWHTHIVPKFARQAKNGYKFRSVAGPRWCTRRQFRRLLR